MSYPWTWLGEDWSRGREPWGGDKGPHRGVGFRNGQKDDMAMGRITGEYFRELMLTQIF